MNHIVMNLETGAFYSESPILKNEAKRMGLIWNKTCILPKFAKQFSRYKDALKCSQQLSNEMDAICSVMSFLSCPFDAGKLLTQHRNHLMTMRDTAPSGEPAQALSVGGEGTWTH